MSIRIFYDEVDFRIKGSRRIIGLIRKVIGEEHKVPGDLNFIFTDDRRLREINIDFLNHDYFTDVITFESNSDLVINGEIYISVDTVKANAEEYAVTLMDEILRVMIHGVLHLVGYDDKEEKDRNDMRRMEDHWIEKFKMQV